MDKMREGGPPLDEIREYRIYRGLIARCEYKNVKAYPSYGGRGIRLSARWRASFWAFWEDMGAAPSQNHGIDRINPDGNYEPGNCRWATPKEQARNKRRTRYVAYKGNMMPLTEAVEVAGNLIHYEAAWIGIKQGKWTVERAVETPRTKLSPNSFEKTGKRYAWKRRTYSYKGQMISIREALAITGLSIVPAMVRDRMVRQGWSFEDAVERPIDTRFCPNPKPAQVATAQ